MTHALRPASRAARAVLALFALVVALAAPPPALSRPATVTAAPAARTEIIHTTASHPWLTADHGWVRAGALRLGEPVARADGAPAVVVALRVLPGAAPMWDLTVSQVHDFAVGAGEYVVHNCEKPDFEEGARQAKKVMGDEYGYNTEDWKYKGVENPDAPNANDDPNVSPDRYYYRYGTPYGDVKVSGNFDPATGEWDDNFHLSGDQYDGPDGYWQGESDQWHEMGNRGASYDDYGDGG